jgi:arylsulfatase A-like enzyme
MAYRVFKLLAAIHLSIGLFAGYWDMRLSDAFLYDGQMARIHYLRTLQSHAILAVAAALCLSILILIRNKSEADLRRERLIPQQVAFAISYLIFLIFGIKTHLVWLQTHLLDPEGLLWTGAVLAASAVGFILIYYLSRRIYTMHSSKTIAGAIFLGALLLTIGDAYFHSQNRKPEGNNAAGKPNVLMILVDTLRWDSLNSYDPAKQTSPALRALAEESVVYDNAIATSPWTTPSHASIFTGQYPSRNGVDGRNIILDPASATLAEVLGHNGYETAGFINNVYIRRQTGLGRGFQQYEEFWGRNEGSSLMLLVELMWNRYRPRRDSGAEETRKSVRQWFRYDWSGSRPFFLFIHFMEPHAIYGIPDDYYREFLPANVTADQARSVNQDPELYICNQIQMSEKDFEILQALYQNDIRYLDDQIRLLMKDLKDRNLLENTLLIFTSDHGEHFGEHRLMSHELSVYDDLIRVPLILRFPKKAHAGARIPNVVQTLDLFPSILELSTLKQTGLNLQGFSLLPDRMERSRYPAVFAEYDNARAADKIERRFPEIPSDPLYRRKVLKTVRTDQHKYIWGSDGTRELYDIKNDPHESRNIYHEDPQTASAMEIILGKWVSSFQPSKFYKQEEISKEALEELRSLGYVQ